MGSDMTLEEVAAAADALEGQPLEAVLEWSFERFGDRLGMTSALGYSGVVLMDHVQRVRPGAEVVFIDTRFHFAETLSFLAQLREHFDLEFKAVQAALAPEAIDAALGPEPWKRTPDLCCHYNKVEPLLRVLPSKDAWLSALRRDQSATRAGIEVIEVDGRGTLKIYPMAAWTREQTWSYIRERGLPYHPLHDQGYPSVGCTHCTTPVAEGEHERAGRWSSMPKLECGLHLHRKKPEGGSEQ